MNETRFSPRLALVLTPLSDENLALAAQIGVTDVVVRYPGTDEAVLRETVRRVAAAGLQVSVVEGYIPHRNIVHGGPGRAEEIAGFRTLLQNMGKAGVGLCCYNFMPDDDWSRTSFDIPERGGARVTGFDAAAAEAWGPAPGGATRSAELWRNLGRFLREVVPAAEDAGVQLCLHPDDPPMSPLRGQERIMTSVEAFERLIDLNPSPANGVCFCQGTFAQTGVDVVAAIRRLGPHIRYVHFRDVVGSVPRFRESFHDNGRTDMARSMAAYRGIGFAGPMRPDHVPVMQGESTENAGYTMLGRLYAIGYMKGLIDAVR